MNEEYNFRMLAFSDYQAFKETCSVSQKELTMFLDLGKYMEYFMISDYWNFFIICSKILRQIRMDYLKVRSYWV
jgi:hypothetical protein